MRPQKVDDSSLLESLMTTLRAKGYDGASLNELANSCGLQKASLYHRFPGGKQEIVLAVLSFVDQWIDVRLVGIVNDGTISAKERLSTILENITAIYHSGESSCILRALSTDSGLGLFGKELKTSTEKWLYNFKKLGLAFGFAEEEAEDKALQVLINIQGSLVIGKTLNSVSPFLKTIKKIEMLYKL